MEKLSFIISVLIPFFSFLSTLLMTYADRHTIPIDPLSVVERAAAETNKSHYNPQKAQFDTKKELHNRKMKWIYNIGIGCLITSFLLSVTFIVLQQI